MTTERIEALNDMINSLTQVLAHPSELIADVKLPTGLAAALMTGRPELARLVPATDLNADQVKELYVAIGTLIETNYALRQHALTVATLVKRWGEAFASLENFGKQITAFAAFEPIKTED